MKSAELQYRQWNGVEGSGSGKDCIPTDHWYGGKLGLGFQELLYGCSDLATSACWARITAFP